MSQMSVRCWHCGWACRRHNQVATDSVAVCCTMLFNFHCNIIVDYAEQLAIAVKRRYPRSLLFIMNPFRHVSSRKRITVNDAFP
jgi:hypothetical protein